PSSLRTGRKQTFVESIVRPMGASLVIIAFTSLLTTSTYARVGETVKQVEARYGKPQRVLHERGSFRELGYGYRGFMVGVSYVGGVCKSEGFARPDVHANVSRGRSADSCGQFIARC